MNTLLRLAADLGAWAIVLIVLAVVVLPQSIRILREYERGVIFRLGNLQGAKGPGLIFLIPIVDRMVKMDLRVVTIDVAKQEVMTRDNVRSMQVPSVCNEVRGAGCLLPFDLAPQALEAIAPSYLSPLSPRERYPKLRWRAGR